MVVAPKRKAGEAFDEPVNAELPPINKRKRRAKNRGTQQPLELEQDGALHPTTVANIKHAQAVPDDLPINAGEVVPAVAPKKKKETKKKDKQEGTEAFGAAKEKVEDTSRAEHEYSAILPTAKRDRRPRKKAKGPLELVLKPEQSDLVKKRRKKVKEVKKASETSTDWTISAGTAGLFLDQDPIIAEEHLILPTQSSVHIYCVRTSLLVRTINIEGEGVVTSCILSSTISNHLLVSTSTGSILKWEWNTGRKICGWKTNPHLIRIVAQSTSDTQESIFALYYAADKGERRISTCVLRETTTSPVSVTCILRKKHISPAVCVLDDGNTVVVCSGRNLVLGQLIGHDGKPNIPRKPEYMWWEVMLPGDISSIDIRGRQELVSSKVKRLALDVAVGLHDGAILIYDDLLFKLKGKERGSKGADVTSRKLHWHRDVVNSVKWSYDGNYLISGGNETVLVIWQLDTNQQQFLPHLSSAICNITVSCAGALYTLKLADNSVMTLSTSDLLPITSIGGLSLTRESLESTIPVAISPSNPTYLLAAVSNNVAIDARTKRASSATMLQTFDISTNHQVAKQALARNVITALNITPHGTRVAEPNVSHLSMSHDGHWLVTVDEWTAPSEDLKALYPTVDHVHAERMHTETCLRFWSWNQDATSWEQVTRVDEPHEPMPSSVLRLATSPARHEFATVGADGYVRIWAPKQRHRDGLPIRNKSGELLATWACIRSLQPAPPPSHGRGSSAALAYAEDGSILAASWAWRSGNSLRPVHFIDTHTGSVCLAQTDLLSNGEGEIAFMGQHLIALSQSLRVWDTVRARTVYSIALKPNLIQSRGSRLAVNPTGRNFAVTLIDVEKPWLTQIVVLSPRSPEPLFKKTLHGAVIALLPIPRTPGYVLVDTKAQLRQLQPPGAALHAARVPMMEESLAKGLDQIFGSRALVHAVDNANVLRDRGGGVGAGRSIRQLEDVFSRQQSSLSALPVRDLFDQVASVFSSPQVQVVVQ